MSTQEHKPLTKDERVGMLRDCEARDWTFPSIGNQRPMDVTRRALLDLKVVERQRDELLTLLAECPLPSTMGSAADHYRRFYGWWDKVKAATENLVTAEEARAALSGTFKAPPAGEGAVTP
jgi:hypothetical protein